MVVTFSLGGSLTALHSCRPHLALLLLPNFAVPYHFPSSVLPLSSLHTSSYPLQLLLTLFLLLFSIHIFVSPSTFTIFLSSNDYPFLSPSPVLFNCYQVLLTYLVLPVPMILSYYLLLSFFFPTFLFCLLFFTFVLYLFLGDILFNVFFVDTGFFLNFLCVCFVSRSIFL